MALLEQIFGHSCDKLKLFWCRDVINPVFVCLQLAYLLSRFQYFVCPVGFNSETIGFTVECETPDIFVMQEYTLPAVLQNTLRWVRSSPPAEGDLQRCCQFNACFCFVYCFVTSFLLFKCLIIQFFSILHSLPLKNGSDVGLLISEERKRSKYALMSAVVSSRKR